jgi:DNA-binding response OmpR family regulator
MSMQKKILIVDDDRDIREILAEGLKDDGYEVTLAKSSLEALSLIPFQSFDVIVTDWQLPLRDGLSLIRTVKEVSPKTPVILISAYGDDELRKRVEESGATYLQKPFSLKLFKDLIMSLVSRI